VSLDLRLHLLAEVSSGATTCPMASGSVFLRGELQCCHVFYGSGFCLSERGAPMLPRPTAPDGLCTIGIKKCLAALGAQLGSRISMARSCVSEALANVQAAIVRSPQCSVGSVDHSCTWLQW
jgi:hypothetical protein